MCTANVESNFFSFAKRIQEEFWRQGDLMKEFDPSATIAPMNDRVYASSTPSHESSLQIGFTLGLVKPLFDLVSVGVVVKHDDMYVCYVSKCVPQTSSLIFFLFFFILQVNSIDGVNLTEPLQCIKDNITTYTALKEEGLNMTAENIARTLEYQIK